MVKSVCVICPVYNEEEVIGSFNDALMSVFEPLENKYSCSVCYVVDPGNDNTIPIIEKMAKQNSRVKLIALSRRFGHQMSLVAGMDRCKDDVLVMMDADLQHPPLLIPEMLKQYEKGYDIVYTRRKKSGEKSFLAKIFSATFYWALKKLSDIDLDSGCADFRLISKNIADIFRNSIRERNQFLRGLFSWVGFKQLAITYDAGGRDKGKSKYSLKKKLQFATNGIISFSKKPLKYSIVLGFIFSLFGAFMVLFTLFYYFYNNSAPSGWATICILICIFGGIQLIFLGIIGQYISAIFDEVKARPLYLIQKEMNFNE